MLLQRLSEYADQIGLPPALYSERPLRYIIELDAAGRLLNRAPIDTADPANPLTRRGLPRLAPQVQRSSAVRPLLLADNAEYTFGIAREDARPERVARCHAAYLELLDRCAAATADPTVLAVQSFLNGNPLVQLDLPADFDAGASITFRVGDTFPIDLPAVQAFWASVNDPAAATEEPPPTMQCLVCGQQRPALPRLQAKLKGIPGGQSAGTTLISANAEAFESYGLKASLVAPTCATCGERFTKAANRLLADRATRYIIGGTVFIFWTRRPVAFSFRTYLDDPQPEQVRTLLAAVYGGGLPDVDETAFYAAALSASGGRAVVRDWIDTTVGEAKRKLASWFRRQRIVDAYGAEAPPLGLYALAAATARDPATELAPPVPRALLRGALTGTPLPTSLLYQAVRRNRAEQGVTRQRAALIKLVRCSGDFSYEEDRMVQLDTSNQDPAYLCGRLLAVLEEAQYLAIPNAKSTIVDRFYGAASAAPASVFGRLLRGSQAHLAKLRHENRAAHLALQRRLEEIQSGLAAFPRFLSLEDQGLFALGYYHQRAFDRAQARAAKARRQTGAPPAPDEALGAALAAEEMPDETQPTITNASN